MCLLRMKMALIHQILVWVSEVAIVLNLGRRYMLSQFIFQLVVQDVAVETQ